MKFEPKILKTAMRNSNHNCLFHWIPMHLFYAGCLATGMMILQAP